MFSLDGRGLLITYSNMKQQLAKSYPDVQLEDKLVKMTIDDVPNTWASAKELVLEQLRTLLPRMTKALIVQERHQDGSLHVHAYVQGFQTIIQPNQLDFFGMHPNIEQVKEPWRVKQYLKKDDKDPLKYVMVISLDSDDDGYLTP